MVTMQPPPAYSGDQATTQSYPEQNQVVGGAGKNRTTYWCFWGVLFGTILTWVFSVSAAADDSWFSWEGVNVGGFDGDCIGSSLSDDDGICSMYTAAKAFQILSTLVISLTLVLVVVAAFMEASIVAKLGLGAAIALFVASVFQLITFALMAAIAGKYDDQYFADVKPGPTLGVAVVAWLFALAGSIATFVLLRAATTDQDGPFRACMTKMNAGAPAGAPTGQPGVQAAATV